jgi:hypothetical protein
MASEVRRVGDGRVSGGLLAAGGRWVCVWWAAGVGWACDMRRAEGGKASSVLCAIETLHQSRMRKLYCRNATEWHRKFDE